MKTENGYNELIALIRVFLGLVSLVIIFAPLPLYIIPFVDGSNHSFKDLAIGIVILMSGIAIYSLAKSPEIIKKIVNKLSNLLTKKAS